MGGAGAACTSLRPAGRHTPGAAGRLCEPSLTRYVYWLWFCSVSFHTVGSNDHLHITLKTKTRCPLSTTTLRMRARRCRWEIPGRGQVRLEPPPFSDNVKASEQGQYHSTTASCGWSYGPLSFYPNSLTPGSSRRVMRKSAENGTLPGHRPRSTGLGDGQAVPGASRHLPVDGGMRAHLRGPSWLRLQEDGVVSHAVSVFLETQCD